MAYTWEFWTEPAEFLAVAGGYLAREPIVNTVIATVAERTAAETAAGVERDPEISHWYAAARDEAGAIVGVAMRTAPFAPYPMLVQAMPEEAARELARVIHERGERPTAINGFRPAAELVAGELARLGGGAAQIDVHMRLHELRELTAPARPARGTLRPATIEDLDLVAEWFERFRIEADEQAGRDAGEPHHPPVDDVRRRIEAGRIWLWLDESGERVHLTAANSPSFGAARIGPVYTPKEHRGHGYASSAVAAISQLILDEGARPILFTDQANPTSNAIYHALGYRPVVDTVEVVIE
ncbi:GNAT family N-acetyltransferase [Nocardioides speluncae]|uniref:GNAT family N-acetyltransferase n=1 Tax=Nocardioides speluncae TaxID=2670337 RepID=UPI000D68705E|nr:GNAT family N-acetyltransferase [Nocardioides speluncae]